MSNRGKIALVIAGGQMCMRRNPQTDIRQPTLPVEEMLSWLPEAQREKLFVVDWSRQPSSHYTLRMTGDLIQVLSKSVVDGAGGLVVTCGTDTIEEMAYLTDLYWAYPQPVIFTAAHRPFDSIGSDAPLNLYQSVLAALSGECWGMGVLVCLQDQLFAAAEITETANQRRCSFLSPDRGPLGQFIGDRVDILRQYRRTRVLDESSPPARDVEVLYASLGGGDRILELLVPDEKRQLDGLVIAAFGGGNVPPSWVPYIKKLCKEDVPVVIVSRCQKGHTLAAPNNFEGSMNRLLEIGVLDGGPLTPMQARIKLAAGLGAGLRKTALQTYLLED
ncbi:asparaginase [Aminivibrio sp.]